MNKWLLNKNKAKNLNGIVKTLTRKSLTSQEIRNAYYEEFTINRQGLIRKKKGKNLDYKLMDLRKTNQFRIDHKEEIEAQEKQSNELFKALIKLPI
jgi:hypothetical protein